MRFHPLFTTTYQQRYQRLLHNYCTVCCSAFWGRASTGPQSARTYLRSIERIYVRYWSTEIIDGQPRRVQRSERLCFKDDKYYSKKAKAVTLLRDKCMVRSTSRIRAV